MRKLFVLVIVTIMMLVGCSSGNKNETEESKVEEGETSNQVYPLTGMEATEDADRRPVAVMVNNHPKARPQSGLSQADLVFEILAEGNITRFLAMYQSEFPDVVGPVRSAREYYFDLAERYDALYVYHGAAKFVNEMILDQNIEYINGARHDNDGIVFKRESFRQAPHNSYFQFDSVNDVAEEKGYELTTDMEPLPFLGEEEVENIDGEATDHVQINYSPNASVAFDYDSENETYFRSSDNEPTVELNSEEPITADNVFIIEAKHEVMDDEGRRAIDLDSGGNALLIQKGQAKEVDWENDDGKIIPTKDGETIGFVPGKTWINVIPVDPGIGQSVTLSGS